MENAKGREIRVKYTNKINKKETREKGGEEIEVKLEKERKKGEG
jgi:hypothetical protein